MAPHCETGFYILMPILTRVGVEGVTIVTEISIPMDTVLSVYTSYTQLPCRIAEWKKLLRESDRDM